MPSQDSSFQKMGNNSCKISELCHICEVSGMQCSGPYPCILYTDTSMNSETYRSLHGSLWILEATYNIFGYVYQPIYYIASNAASFDCSLQTNRALQQLKAVVHVAPLLISYSLTHAILLEICEAKRCCKKCLESPGRD